MIDNKTNDVMTVDAVSRQLGITPRTLRYYEEVGLVSPTTRSNGGHRLYDENAILRLKQILRLKENLGISLQEIQEIITAQEALQKLQQTFHENGQNPDMQKLIVKRYMDVLQNLVSKMNEKIENVSMMRDMYQEKLERSIRFLDEMESK